MPVHSKDIIQQIRLLLPATMVNELNTIAASREISRLALIRFFLRNQINQELDELQNYLDAAESRKQTQQQLQDLLKKHER